MLSLEGNQISVMLSCMSLEVNNVFLEVLSACLSSYSPQRQPATPSTSSFKSYNGLLSPIVGFADTSPEGGSKRKFLLKLN